MKKQNKAKISKKVSTKKEKKAEGKERKVEWIMTVKSFEKNGCMINSN